MSTGTSVYPCCLINNFRGLPLDELSCAAAVNSDAKVGQCGCLFSALSHSNPPATLYENVRLVSCRRLRHFWGMLSFASFLHWFTHTERERVREKEICVQLSFAAQAVVRALLRHPSALRLAMSLLGICGDFILCDCFFCLTKAWTQFSVPATQSLWAVKYENQYLMLQRFFLIVGYATRLG